MNLATLESLLSLRERNIFVVARTGRLINRIFKLLTEIHVPCIVTEVEGSLVGAGAGRVLSGSTSRRDGLTDGGSRCARLGDIAHGIVLARRRVLVRNKFVLVTEVHIVHFRANGQ